MRKRDKEILFRMPTSRHSFSFLTAVNLRTILSTFFLSLSSKESRMKTVEPLSSWLCLAFIPYV